MSDAVKWNKADLVTPMADKSGMTKVDAEKALDAFLESIQDALKEQAEVRLVGFGVFYVSKRAASVGRNPRTGAEVNLPEAYIPKFKAGKQLKEAVDKKA